MCGEGSPGNCLEKGDAIFRPAWDLDSRNMKSSPHSPVPRGQEEWGCQLPWSPVDLWELGLLGSRLNVPCWGPFTLTRSLYPLALFYSSTEEGELIPSWRLSKLTLRHDTHTQIKKPKPKQQQKQQQNQSNSCSNVSVEKPVSSSHPGAFPRDQ